MSQTPDCLIIGGGVIGLSLAYELAARGARVRLIDRSEPGQEASWAGAGILPPASPDAAGDPLAWLAALSLEQHVQWSKRLSEESGIDNGLRQCGAVYVARSDRASDEVASHAARQRADGIAFDELAPDELAHIEPALADARVCPPIQRAWYVPAERQIRNPRHLKALVVACSRAGVEIAAGVEAFDFDTSGDRVMSAITSSGRISAGSICVTGGAWSRQLLSRLGIDVPLAPIRGQIVLLEARPPLLSHIVNEGARYLVPRDDGRILIGSTEEPVGFDKRPTAGGAQGLLDLALGLAPALAEARVERCWAGLRPATPDHRPLLGRVPGLSNAFVAAGHFRSGLLLSTGTAAVLADLMSGSEPPGPLEAFRPDRF